MAAVPEIIVDITDPELRGVLREFGSPVKARPLTVGRGDSGPRRFRFVEPTGSDRRTFRDANTTSYAIKVAVGNLDAAPTGGSYTITRNAAASTLIAYNASAATVESALEGIAGFPGTGVTVTKYGDNGYEIRFSANGAQAFPLVAGANLLEPETNIVLTEIQPGDAGSPTILWLRLLQAPIALQDTFSAYPTGSASVTTLVEGSATQKELIRISIDQPPYDGSITINFGTVEKFTITVTQNNNADAMDGLGFIMFDEDGLSVGVYFDGTPDASILATDRQINVNTLVTGDSKATVATKLATAIAADGSFTATASGNAVKVTLENAGEVATPVDVDSTFTFAVTQTGENVVNSVPVNASARDFAAAIGNVCSVTKTGEFQWDLKFRDYGNQPSVTVDASALFPTGYEGELNFLTRQCLRAFQATTDAFISPYLEIELTPPGEGSFTVLHIPITIVRDIIADEMDGSATVSSYYTSSEIDALIASLLDGTTAFTVGIIASLAGSVAANGDIEIQGTTHGTKASSFVNIQPNGGSTQIGDGNPGSNTSIGADQFIVFTPTYTIGLFVTDGSWAIGDVGSDVNGTVIAINDSAQTVDITAANGLNLNSSSAVRKFLTATATYDPPSTLNGASQSTIITLNGVVVGDVVTAAHSSVISDQWAIQATVIANNTVSVRLTNNTGGTVDLASGTLRVNCIKF